MNPKTFSEANNSELEKEIDELLRKYALHLGNHTSEVFELDDRPNTKSKLLALIRQHTDKAVLEARIDELVKIRNARDRHRDFHARNWINARLANLTQPIKDEEK